MDPITEQLDALIQTPTYQALDEAVKQNFILAKDALVLTYTNEDYWMSLQGHRLIQNAPWTMRMAKFMTTAQIDGKPIHLTFASLTPQKAWKDALRQGPTSAAYTEATGAYAGILSSMDFAQTRLHLGALFQQLHGGQTYFFFPMNACYGLLEPYDYDLILPYFDVLSFNAAQKKDLS